MGGAVKSTPPCLATMSIKRTTQFWGFTMPDIEEMPVEATVEETVEQPEESKTEQQDDREAADKLKKKVKRSERSVKSYQFFILRLLLLILVLWILFFKVVGLTHMPSEDMYPRIDAGDMVLFYRLEKNFKAQDIVVIEKTTPEHPDKKELFICRVVAAPGDTVEISDGERLIVNGNVMIEKNIFYATPRYEGFTTYPLKLSDSQVFVLADSREGGTDSRYFGPVEKDEILGSVITILRRNNL